jgi:hypothetical protein
MILADNTGDYALGTIRRVRAPTTRASGSATLAWRVDIRLARPLWSRQETDALLSIRQNAHASQSAALSKVIAEILIQPGLGVNPLTVGGANGDIHRRGGLFRCEAGEITEFDGLGGVGVLGG